MIKNISLAGYFPTKYHSTIGNFNLFKLFLEFCYSLHIVNLKNISRTFFPLCQNVF